MNDRDRADALAAYGILDTPPEARFDRICAMAARLFHAPMAAIAFAAEHRYFVKSAIGFSPGDLPRSNAPCSEPAIHADARESRRFHSHPLVTGPPYARLFACAPVRNTAGIVLGGLWVLDPAPRPDIGSDELPVLADLASMVGGELELRVMERERSQAARLLASVYEASPVGIAVIDEDGRCVEANSAYCRLLGYDQHEIVGRYVRDYLDGDAGAEAGHAHRAFLAGTEMPPRWRVVRKDGTSVDLHLTASRLMAEDGRQLRVTTIMDLSRTLKAETDLQRVLESITDGFITLDRDWRFTYMNTEARRLLGLGDLTGRIIWDVFPGPAYLPFRRQYEKVLAEQQPAHFEGFSPLMNAWVEVHAYPSPEGLSIYFRDISERKNASAVLAQAAAILESTDDAVIGKSLDGTIVSWNPAAERMYGYAAQEMIGRPIALLVPPGIEDDTGPLLERLSRGERIQHYETLRQRKDGSTIEVSLTISPIRGTGGAVSGGAIIARDITEDRRGARALEQLNATLRTIIEAAPVAIWALDPDGNVRFWNPAAERIFGWTEEEALGRWPPFIRPDEEEDFRALLERYRRGESMRGVEHRRYRRDGSMVHISAWTAPLRDPAGNITGTLGVVVDVTDQKRLEEQLVHAQKMEAVALLAGGIAHDFNNLLTIIIGYCRLMLLDIPEDAPVREAADEILFAADRASALTSQLLAFSRRQVMQPRIVDLNEIVMRMEKMLRRILGEDIDLNACLAPNLGCTIADPGHIEQVIANLAVNARDAMPDGGKLTIETANVEFGEERVHTHSGPSGNFVMLSVSDTGGGIPAAVRQHIFEPFFTTKEKGKGTGLGLSIIHGIVKQAGGDILVYSEPGHGATFKIYLPRTDKSAEPAAKPTAEGVSLRGNETVVVAEDEPAVRKILCAILAGAGYSVLEAENARNALDLCRAKGGQIDLLLTDVVMPGMGGADLAREATKQRPNLRVLYISGYTDKAVVQHEILSEQAAFLQKPFTPEALLAKVKEVLTA